ncbi:hypothetical protein [Micromonospora peucetia]|uniref:Uncharacterized protein n=1 Tax=Micromonospora peucetia TaxID=47871 RepID=A0ABZ1E8R6_9ACTN|nr:hypothetical protein [Micromonospora peucetia]WSA30432.1 hypothetical protein OIE14_19780 [Micromonospora peucetia]
MLRSGNFRPAVGWAAALRAALIYQHANSERDREIADAMDRRIAKHAKRAAALARLSKTKDKATMDTPTKGKAAKQNAPKEKPAARKATKYAKPKRPAREPVSDGTAGATGTPMARKIKEG